MDEPHLVLITTIVLVALGSGGTCSLCLLLLALASRVRAFFGRHLEFSHQMIRTSWVQWLNISFYSSQLKPMNGGLGLASVCIIVVI